MLYLFFFNIYLLLLFLSVVTEMANPAEIYKASVPGMPKFPVLPPIDEEELGAVKEVVAKTKQVHKTLLPLRQSRVQQRQNRMLL